MDHRSKSSAIVEDAAAGTCKSPADLYVAANQPESGDNLATRYRIIHTVSLWQLPATALSKVHLIVSRKPVEEQWNGHDACTA